MYTSKPSFRTHPTPAPEFVPLTVVATGLLLIAMSLTNVAMFLMAL